MPLQLLHQLLNLMLLVMLLDGLSLLTTQVKGIFAPEPSENLGLPLTMSHQQVRKKIRENATVLFCLLFTDFDIIREIKVVKN